MKLPSFNELAREQLDVFEFSPYQSVLVVGPPGSGKTSMAIWRARMMASPELGMSVTLITKNRLLCAVAGQIARENGNDNIGTSTMNSFVWNDYNAQFQKNPPLLAPWFFDWEQIMVDYAAADVEPYLNHLIIDEGQNLPYEFFQWAKLYGAKEISVFADEHQTTEEYGISIRELRNLGFSTVIPLVINHRNTLAIAKLLSHFHMERKIPQASPVRGIGTPPQLLEINEWDGLADLVARRFRNRRETIGVIVYGAADVKLLEELLQQRLPDTRVDAYTSGLRKGEEHSIQMREEGVTVISGESAIGLEFDSLYLQDLDRSLPTQTPLQHRRLYMLCARAKDALFLVNGPKPLSKEQLNSLPSSPILEQ